MSDAREDAYVRLHPNDNIVVCIKALKKGEAIKLAGAVVVLETEIQVGHKICVSPIAVGGKIIKYGASIGSAIESIKVGDHVHIHNMKSDYISSNVREH
jgi:(2R)-sulfolactate sulfo-lyase subunit alpha